MNDDWKKYFCISEQECDRMYVKSLSIWNNFNIKKNGSLHESDKYPMHPDIFIKLSNVIGFNKLNGYSYEDYISKWKERKLYKS